MEKTQQIKAQITGPTALIAILAIVGNHYARKYGFEIETSTLTVAITAVFVWWVNRHIDKTATKLDVGAALSGLTFSELKAFAAHVDQLKADPTVAANTTQEAVALTMQQVAQAQQQIPSLNLKDALAVATGKGEIRD